MSKSLIKRLVLLLALNFSVIALGDENFTVPKLANPVTDMANLLDADSKQRLEEVLQILKRSGGSQIAVLTVQSIGDLTIEQASIKVTDQWQLGDKKRDDGVLVFIVSEIHGIRIEVGQGLEGDLPDAIAKRIIDDVISPFFKKGDFSNGIFAGVYQIAKVTNPSLNIDQFFRNAVEPTHRPQQSRKQRPLSLFELIIFAIVMLLLILTRTGRKILFFMLIFGSRGGHGGRRGGGGFGGGGGGFSGGGASGGW